MLRAGGATYENFPVLPVKTLFVTVVSKESSTSNVTLAVTVTLFSLMAPAGKNRHAGAPRDIAVPRKRRWSKRSRRTRTAHFFQAQML